MQIEVEDDKKDGGRDRLFFSPLNIHQWRGRKVARKNAAETEPKSGATEPAKTVPRKVTYEVKGGKNFHLPLVVEAFVELDKGKKDPAVIRRRGKEIIFDFEDTAAAKETMDSIREHKSIEVQSEREKHGFRRKFSLQ